MALPVAGIATILANSPRAVQILQGLGILTGGTIAAGEAKKQLDQLPEGSLEEAYKRVFLGPSSELINKDLFKPSTPTAQPMSMETQARPTDQGQVRFQETPSGLVLGPDEKLIEANKERFRGYLKPPAQTESKLFEVGLKPGQSQTIDLFPKEIKAPPATAGKPLIESFPIDEGAKQPIIMKAETKGAKETAPAAPAPTTEKEATQVFRPNPVDLQRIQQIQDLAPTTQLPGVGPLTFDPKTKPAETDDPTSQNLTKENLPEVNKPTFNFKNIYDRSVGQERGQKAVNEIYNNSNFSDVLTPEQLKYINDLEISYVGGVGDLGNPLVPAMFENPTLQNYQEYMQDYQEKLANIAEKQLGKQFKTYRLMDRDTAMKMMQGEIPNTKVMQMDEKTGEDKLVEYQYEGMFGTTTVPQEAMGFSLSPRDALAFRDFSFSGAREKPDEDFVLMEYNANPTDIVMRGHEGEKELVLRTADSPPTNFTIYDINFKKTKTGRDISATKNKEFEKIKQDYVGKKTTKTKPEETESKYTLARELDPKLIDELLKTRGGIKGFQESMQSSMAPLPPSTKRQMFIQLNDKIMAKYGFDKTDKDPETMPPEELKKLQQKYFAKQDGIDYITSAIYDVIGGPTTYPGRDTIFALDDEGLPVAAVKLGTGDIPYEGRQEAIVITEAGSLFPEAFDQIIQQVKAKAKEQGKKFIVAEDLTTEQGFEALKRRGFKPTTSKKYKKFEGKLVRRPGGGRKVKQKNLVLEIE